MAVGACWIYDSVRWDVWMCGFSTLRLRVDWNSIDHIRYDPCMRFHNGKHCDKRYIQISIRNSILSISPCARIFISWYILQIHIKRIYMLSVVYGSTKFVARKGIFEKKNDRVIYLQTQKQKNPVRLPFPIYKTYLYYWFSACMDVVPKL